MAGLPKKYAKMGFKKGWKAYKASKRTTRKKPYKAKTKTNKRKTGGKKTMFNFGGGLGKGIAAGAVVGIVNRFLPINIAGVDYIIAGMVMKEPVVQKLGAITLGRSLAGSITGGLVGGGNGGNGMVR